MVIEKKNKIQVLTTSPSININNNVSGISNMTKLWVKNNTLVNYLIFEVGKKDKMNYSFFWFLYQPFIVLKFVFKLLVNKINIVHINMPLEKLAIPREFCFILISSLFKKSIIIHLRGGIYNLNKNTPKLLRLLIRKSLNRSIKIIVLGEKESLFLSKEFRIDDSKILVLPNAVKIPAKISMNNFKRFDRFNILYLGRLDKNKGLIEIVKSLKSFSLENSFMLNIAGDGPDKDWFLRECEFYIPNQYNYLGVVSGFEKQRLLYDSHIFLLPSYFEGLPNALLEAMSYGIIPIVTAVGSISDVVSNNINGIIVPVKSIEAILEALKKINHEPSFYKKLSEEASRTILKNFSIDNYLILMNKLYSDLLIEH